MNESLEAMYFDYAASTPVHEVVLERMMPYFSSNYGNSSAVHTYGRRALDAIDAARLSVANFLNCAAAHIVFTSGATESNNLAIFGLVQNYSQPGNIVVSSIEHVSVREVVAELESRGWSVTYVQPTDTGVIECKDVLDAIRSDTRLVSCMYVNNEIGTIQPISELAAGLQSINKNRETPILFHCDATQAAPYLRINAQECGVDFLTISGHKMYGPKGIGVLYVRDKKTLSPMVFGGAHEWGLRSGTLNTPGIIGIGAACDFVQSSEYKDKLNEILVMRDSMLEQLTVAIPGIELNGSKDARVQGIINVHIPGIDVETFIPLLDAAKVYVSAGSACAAGSVEPSLVLMSAGNSQQWATESFRLSLGLYTTQQQIATAVAVITNLVSSQAKN